MIEFGGKCGYPWHGLYRSATGKIDTPGGISIDPPGSYPSADVYGRAGDCFSVQLPGMPAVATTTTEQEAGMTWLNYALLSGHDRVLCGRDLGENSWIAIADGKPWRIQCTLSISGGLLYVYAVVSRFGIFLDAPPPQILSFSHSIAYESFGVMAAFVDDQKNHGMSVLVGISQLSTATRKFGGAVELNFSYAAGMWSCFAQTVVDYETTTSTTIYESTSTPTLSTADIEVMYCFGVRYSAAGAIQRIELRMRNTGQATYNGAAPGMPGAGTGSSSGWLRFLIGGAVIREVVYSSSLSWAETGQYVGAEGSNWYRAEGTNSITIDGHAFNRNFTEDSLSDLAHRSVKGAALLQFSPSRDTGDVLSFRGQGGVVFGFKLTKHCASLYGLSMVFGGSSSTVYSSLVGKVGVAAEEISQLDYTHATEHPVTGQIVRGTSLVCWV